VHAQSAAIALELLIFLRVERREEDKPAEAKWVNEEGGAVEKLHHLSC